MINGKIIKVCGMCEAENIRDVEALEGIDMLGFIFIPNLRDISMNFPLIFLFTPSVSEYL